MKITLKSGDISVTIERDVNEPHPIEKWYGLNMISFTESIKNCIKEASNQIITMQKEKYFKLNTMYSQNSEQQFITDYFKDFTGTLLDIGANDGKTLSNSLRLIELGWEAILIEPSPSAFEKLEKLHENNLKVNCFNVAIGTENGKMILHESGAHFKDHSDHALLSSLKQEETSRWKKAGVDFKEIEVDVVTYETLVQPLMEPIVTFDFISIDAEGMDVEILKQIDLTHTKLLCIEWNSNPETYVDILEYCSKFGLTNLLHRNPENLLLTRP